MKTSVKDEPPQEPKDTSLNMANTKTKSKTPEQKDGSKSETHLNESGLLTSFVNYFIVPKKK